PKEEREQFGRALEAGRRISRLRQARREVPEELRRQYEIESAPILKKVKAHFGGCIRLATSGGAPLPLEVAEFFDAAGLPILQADGQTETSCVGFNRSDNHKLGSVGPPLPGWTVKCSDDGQILGARQL